MKWDVNPQLSKTQVCLLIHTDNLKFVFQVFRILNDPSDAFVAYLNVSAVFTYNDFETCSCS